MANESYNSWKSKVICMGTQLRWGNRVLTKQEVATIDEALNRVMMEVAKLSAEIKDLATTVGAYVHETKKMMEQAMGLGVDEGQLKEIAKSLDNVDVALTNLKRVMQNRPVVEILKGNWKHAQVVSWMRKMAEMEQQKQEEMQTVLPALKDVLKGRKTVSQFVVEQMRQREREKYD